MYLQDKTIGSILNPLAGKFSEDTRKKGKGAKTGETIHEKHVLYGSYDWQSFYLSQYDWLKGSHMTKVVGFRMKPIIHNGNLWRQILPIVPTIMSVRGRDRFVLLHWASLASHRIKPFPTNVYTLYMYM